MSVLTFPFACLLFFVICCNHGLTRAFPSDSNVPARTASSLYANTPPTYKKKAIVVGGGPVGLAAALTLSNPPHCMDVTLFEQATPSEYDPTKAYLYNVNLRGQTWTQRFPTVQQRLEDRGSGAGAGFANFVIVPADPKEEIPQPKELGASALKMTNRSYWIPRHTMTSLLEETIRDEQANRSEDVGCVELCLGKKFVSIETQQDGMLKVTVENVSDPNIRYQEMCTANLVVGADGMNSGVSSNGVHHFVG